MPSVRIAAATESAAPGVWTTVSMRCIRLNSSVATEAMPPSFLRISVSSVGQSICMMRKAERSWPSASRSVPGSGASVSAAGAQQSAPWSWLLAAWSWSA